MPARRERGKKSEEEQKGQTGKVGEGAGRERGSTVSDYRPGIVKSRHGGEEERTTGRGAYKNSGGGEREGEQGDGREEGFLSCKEEGEEEVEEEVIRNTVREYNTISSGRSERVRDARTGSP